MRVAILQSKEDAVLLSDIVHCALVGDVSLFSQRHPDQPDLQIEDGLKYPGYSADDWAVPVKDPDSTAWAIPFNVEDSRIQWLIDHYPEYLLLVGSRIPYLAGFQEVDVRDWHDPDGVQLP